VLRRGEQGGDSPEAKKNLGGHRQRGNINKKKLTESPLKGSTSRPIRTAENEASHEGLSSGSQKEPWQPHAGKKGRGHEGLR